MFYNMFLNVSRETKKSRGEFPGSINMRNYHKENACYKPETPSAPANAETTAIAIFTRASAHFFDNAILMSG